MIIKKVRIIFLFSFFCLFKVNASLRYLKCPVTITISESECKNLLADSAKSEDPKRIYRNKFNEVYKSQFVPILNNILLDNQSNANFIAEKAIYELRVHKECLRSVCDTIFNKCGDIQDSQTSNFDMLDNNNTECHDIMERYFEIRKTQLVNNVIKNQSRKDRSLLKQKLVALINRFQVYFHPILSEIAREYERLKGKIDSTVTDPKT